MTLAHVAADVCFPPCTPGQSVWPQTEQRHVYNVDIGRGKSGVIDNCIELGLQLPLIIVTAVLALMSNPCRCDSRNPWLRRLHAIRSSAWFAWVHMVLFWWFRPLRRCVMAVVRPLHKAACSVMLAFEVMDKVRVLPAGQGLLALCTGSRVGDRSRRGLGTTRALWCARPLLGRWPHPPPAPWPWPLPLAPFP
jgi:hypothetical protein